MKSIFIENSVSSFEDFHDSEWIREIFGIADDAGYGEIVEDFVTDWWGSSRSFTLPWLLVDGVYNAVKVNNPDIDKDNLWETYLENNAFKAALWKTAENSYCSIYYAYENLVVRMLSHLMDENMRVTDRSFNSNVAKVFGESLVGRIWTSPKIVVAKEVRNAIVHNGGKATLKLLRMKKTPTIENGDVMISASDTRALYNYLKPLVSEIINGTKTYKCS